MLRPYGHGGSKMPQSKFDPKIHHRKSIRLPKYGYSSNGAYFVTIVTYQRDCLFGEIANEETLQGGNVILNEYGIIADECWSDIPNHFPFVELGAYVVMPNHAHGIIVINHPVGATRDDIGRGAAMLRPYDDNPHKINVKPGSLGTIIRSYKSAVSYRIHKEHNATGIWQRNYYEHIIRDEKDMQRITDYIHANPMRWNDDDENPRIHV